MTIWGENDKIEGRSKFWKSLVISSTKVTPTLVLHKWLDTTFCGATCRIYGKVTSLSGHFKKTTKECPKKPTLLSNRAVCRVVHIKKPDLITRNCLHQSGFKIKTYSIHYDRLSKRYITESCHRLINLIFTKHKIHT